VTLLAARVPPGAIAVNSSTPLWYLTRATGLVALVLLTASTALGLLSSAVLAGDRCSRLGGGWPASS